MSLFGQYIPAKVKQNVNVVLWAHLSGSLVDLTYLALYLNLGLLNLDLGFDDRLVQTE